MYTNLVLSSGSVKGASFLGCLKVLEEQKLVHAIRNIVGTSAGALIGFMVCLGYTSHDAHAFLKTQISSHSIEFEIEQMFDVYYSMGLNDGNNMLTLIQDMVYHKMLKRDVTFMELAKVAGKNLVVCASNLTKECPEYFCVDNAPHMSVVTALRMSCSIPVLFTPVSHDGCMYVDGAIFDHFPIRYFATTAVPLKNTLGICIHVNDARATEPENMLDFMNTLLNKVIKKANGREYDNVCNNVCIIEYLEPHNDAPKNHSGLVTCANGFAYDVSLEEMDAYFAHGYETFKTQFTAWHASSETPPPEPLN